MRKILAMVLIGALVFSMIPLLVPGVAEADAVSVQSAGELQYPIDDYVVDGYHFGQFLPTEEFPSRYHLGEDICKDAGTQVVAMADGVVKLANGNHATYGGLIVIEHTLADGNTYCSLYGHLKHSKTLVEPGNTVSKGQSIGELSDDPADYGGPDSCPHLHFGIRYGHFPSESALDSDTTSGWYWGGYGKKDPRTVSDWWIKPSDFIAGQSTIDLSLVSCYSQKFPFIYLTVRASSDGQPLSDLTKDDFSVTEDGRPQTDMFDVVPPEEGGGVRLADVVFLIDTSGSMGNEIAAVRNNCVAFADALAASDIDYRLGLVQFGQGANYGNPRIIGSGLTASASEFQSWVALLGASGGIEPGFAAIRLAIQSYSFRPGAQKVFILITDEDSDCRDKQTTIDMILANDVTVHVAARCSFGTSEADYCGPGSVRDVSGGLLFPVTGDYRSILDTIGEAVANAYIVRYRTDNPAFDGSERTVVCTVQRGTATDFVQFTYVPGGAPYIQRTEETLALHEQSLVAASSPVISVIVTDAVAPFVQDVFLYVRTSGSSTGYVQISMSSQGNDMYSAAAPAGHVDAPGLDYYIRATDGQVTSSDPTTDPDTNPYQIAVLPNEAPVIVHTPPASWQAGTDIALDISASDSTYGVASLDVYYRKQGDLLWQSVSKNYNPPVTSISENVLIPVAAWSTQVIEYYIKVTDDLGVSACCPMGGADGPFMVTKSDALQPKSWTVLVYMDGDNDCETGVIDSFIEMASVGSSSDVNIVVQMDRVDGNHLPPDWPWHDDTRYGDWAICHRFFVNKGMEPTETNAISDWGDGTGGREVNMGDPDTLASFVNWAAESYPADRYGLILSGHGMGFRGFGHDMTSQGDSLSLLELKDALGSVAVSFDVIGFNACYMGLIEVAYQIRDHADYILASQEKMPYAGLPCGSILGDLISTPSMSGKEFAEAIVTRYAEYYGPDAPDKQKDAITTISAVCTAGLDVLAVSLDEFSRRLESHLWTHKAQIEQSRDSAESYSLPNGIPYYENIYVDIRHFAELVKRSVPEQGVRDAADSVVDAIDDTVISEWHYNPDGKHPNSHGLSVYFTKEDHPERQYDLNYDDLDFSIRTHWNEFVRQYLLIARMATATGTGTAFLVPNIGVIEDLVALPAPADTPSGVIFPHGMFSFKVTGLTPGQTSTITIELPSALPVGTRWWKHHNGVWYSLPNETDNGDNTMTITMMDGGLGDADGLADGVITDPGGPGVPLQPPTAGVAYPVWSILLAGFMAGTGLWLIRRREAGI